jgi:hypothetical protein
MAVVESKKEKIKFLESIKGIAEENSSTIGESGVAIFDADCRQYQEKCIIGIKLDDNGKAYFTIHGTYAQDSDRIINPETLLIAGDRYLPSDINKFKSQFHLYKDYSVQTHETDLVNIMR